MKKIISTNRISHYLLALLLAGGIWVGCSRDSNLVATKTESSYNIKFHPQANVDYDPFAGMSFEDRTVAIGGPETVFRYLQVITCHFAYAMNDNQARRILHQVVPPIKSDDEAIHVSQIAFDYPDIFRTISAGFKDAIAEKTLVGELARIIANTESDSEAMLKCAIALLNLELSVVTPERVTWQPDEKIPVFYVPLDDSDGAIIEGMDANGKTLSIIINTRDETVPYTLLYLNFDEDSPQLDA